MKYTKDLYLELPEGFPAQLLDGVLIRDPAPSAWHQTIAAEIHFRLRTLLGPHRVLESPIDVFVDEHNVLQPDVLVLAEEDRTHPETRHVAIPKIVFEVLSPATADRDRMEKAKVYLRAGIAEVWLVDPETETIEVRTQGGAVTHGPEDPAESRAIPGFRLAYRELTTAP